MALVAVYTNENCPGIPEGARAEVWDDDLEPDQQAAWARARAVANRIYWAQQRRKTEGNANGKV